MGAAQDSRTRGSAQEGRRAHKCAEHGLWQTRQCYCSTAALECYTNLQLVVFPESGEYELICGSWLMGGVCEGEGN